MYSLTRLPRRIARIANTPRPIPVDDSRISRCRASRRRMAAWKTGTHAAPSQRGLTSLHTSLVVLDVAPEDLVDCVGAHARAGFATRGGLASFVFRPCDGGGLLSVGGFTTVTRARGLLFTYSQQGRRRSCSS